MKFLIASDIHGAYRNTERLYGIFTEEKPDMLLLLGDLLYHGPRNDLPDSYQPKKTIEVLSAMKDSILAIRGNCEAEVDQMVLPFPVLSETAMVFADGKRILMTHGHTITPDKAPGSIDAFFSGHTHIPVLKKENGLILLNPGSLSIPKGGFPPSYAVWTDGEIEVKELFTGNTMLTYRESGE